jgi:hypothetical protein
MSSLNVMRLGLIVALSFVSALGIQHPNEPTSPLRIHHPPTPRPLEKLTPPDRARTLAPRADWQKAQADASKLLALARQIDGQLQGKRGQISAALPAELKEVQKLAKLLRRELLL